MGLMGMTQEELKEDVFRFVEDLSAKTGVEIDPNGVWADLQSRMVRK